MEVLRTISLYVEGKEMPFLVIGGNAINAYGISRQTGDLDLLVQRDAKEQWCELLQRLNYQSGQDTPFFARFKPDEIAAWPIDLMFVNSDTFKKMYGESEQHEIGVASVNVVSPKHLLMLKIHALKQYQAHRFLKDFNDVIMLLKDGHVTMTDDELREVCEKYATSELYAKMKETLG